ARERAGLEAAIRDAKAKAEQCREESQAAAEAATISQSAADERAAERRGVEGARNQAAHNRRNAETRASEACAAFKNACAELSAELAERVEPIGADGFPSETDVTTARETKQLLADRTRARDKLHGQRQERDNTVAAMATLEQAVRAIGAPPDVSAARADLAD